MKWNGDAPNEARRQMFYIEYLEKRKRGSDSNWADEIKRLSESTWMRIATDQFLVMKIEMHYAAVDRKMDECDIDDGFTL